VPPQTHLPAVWAEARALRDRGDLDGARTLLEDSLDTATFQFGEDHPDVLNTGHLLATMHRRAGDLTAARRVLEEAINAGELRLTDEDPVMLRLSFELARIADELGNRHEARKHYTRVATHGPSAEGFAEPVREALAWLGPQAPTSATPIVNAPGPVAGGPPPAWPVDATSAPVQRPPVMHRDEMPLPSMSAPLRFPVRDDDDADFVRFVPEAIPTPAPLPVPVFQSAPTVVVERRARGPMIAAIVAAGTAIVAAIIAVLVMLGGQPPVSNPVAEATSDAPSAPEHKPATNVTLIDRGTSIKVTWTDPGGTNGFAIMMGKSPQTLTLITGKLNGVTSFNEEGLNTKFNYCFQVLAVYNVSEQPIRSETVCTKRNVHS